MDAPINISLNGERLWLNVFPDNYLWAEGKKTTSGLFRYFLINNTSSMKSWIVHEEHGFAFCSQFERKSEDFNLFPRTLKNSLHYNTLLVVAKSFRRVAITEWNFSYFFQVSQPIIQSRKQMASGLTKNIKRICFSRLLDFDWTSKKRTGTMFIR